MRQLRSILFGVLSVVCLSGFSNPPHETNDWDEFGLRGAVKSIRTIYYEATEANGEVTEGERREAASPISSEAESFVRFDSTGRRLEYSSFGVDGRLLIRHVFIYDSLGNCLEKTAYNSEGLLCKDATVLDERGRIIRTDEYDADGNVTEHTIYKYDSRGNLSLKEIYFSDRWVHRVEYWYDRRGNIVREKTSMNPRDGSEDWDETVYTYYRKNDLVKKEEWRDSDGYKEVYKYEYDDNGNVVSWRKYYSYDDIDNEWKYSYDEYGNEIQKTGIYYSIPWKGAWNRVHEYDDYGNWRRVVIYYTDANDNTVPETIIEREIEYYE